jgi:broad specificity phosphatase PhoE
LQNAVTTCKGIMETSPAVGRTGAMAIALVLATLMTLGAPHAHAAAAASGESEAAWRALAEGRHIALMRHAEAPGTGDPPGFRLEDCSTQRTLSADGRAQARRLGEAFRAREVAIERIYSSQWCRCLETAELVAVAPVEPQPLLNSYFGRPEVRALQLAALKGWLSDLAVERPLLLVTHQVVITDLTGVFPASGEIVVLRRDGADGWAVVGRIAPP